MAAPKKTKQVADPAPAPVRTADSGDAHVSWTVQSGNGIPDPHAIPGQVFVPAQLPNPEAQAAHGMDPSLVNAGLVVLADEEAANHPGGPESYDPLAGTAAYAGTANAAARTEPDAADAPA